MLGRKLMTLRRMLRVVLACLLFTANSSITESILNNTQTKPGEFNVNLVRAPRGDSKVLSSDKLKGNSYLQVKYVAQDYLQLDSKCTSDCEFNAAMRDIPYNGFTGVVGFGSHPQKLYCIYDTGSSILFVK